jgi:hypothetical protein
MTKPKGEHHDVVGHPNDVDPQRAPLHGPFLEVDAADLIAAARERSDPPAAPTPTIAEAQDDDDA